MWWFAAMWACAGSQPVQESAPVDAVDVVPALAQPVQACVDALAAQRARGASTDREATKICAEVYKAPDCRAAWLDASEMTGGAFFIRIADACRAAYCPSLSPAPPICAGETLDMLGALKGWPALQVAIFTHDWPAAEQSALREAYAPPSQRAAPAAE